MFDAMRSNRTLRGCSRYPCSLWGTAVLGGILIGLVVLPISYPALGQLGMGLHGKKVYQEMDLQFAFRNPCIPLSEEQFASVWSQTDFDGVRRVHLQIVSNEQRLSFPNNPPALSLNNPSDNAIICRGPNGGAYVAWCERRGDNRWVIMLQRLNSNGSTAWRQGGIEVTTQVNGIELYPSSEGDCFIKNGNIVYAYDQSGEAVDGWPLRDHEISYLLPDNEGGFWFRNAYNGEGNRLYRVGSDGRIVGGAPLVLEPPADDYRIMWHVDTYVHDGIQVSADHIFAVWSAGIRLPTMVGVYDFSGELQRFDILIGPNNDEFADFLSMSHLVTPDNRLVAVYNHINDYWWGGDGGHIQTPMYAPQVICYAPFEDNPYPFSRELPVHVGSYEGFAEWFQINAIGGNYFVGYFPFDRDGQQLWEGAPPSLGELFPIGDKAWVFKGYDSEPFYAYQINDRANRENEAEISRLVPYQRERRRTMVLPTANGGCDILMVDKFRGLTGQYINSEGRLSNNPAAGVLDPLWKDNYNNKYSYGSFVHSHWSAVRIYGGRKINLVVCDDDGNVQVSVSHDFTEDSIGITDYTSPIGNGRDRLLVTFRNRRTDGARLIELNATGEVTRSVDLDLGYPELLDYWPGQGWLYLDQLPNSHYWRANLIDDDLNIRWRRELDYQGSDNAYDNPDQLAFHDTTAIVYWFDRRSRMVRAEIGASSTALRSDSLYFFSEEVINWRTSGGWLRIAADGGWWLMFLGSRLQKLADDGTRVYGDSGLVFTNDIHYSYLLPDREGGAWVIWEKSHQIDPESKIRAIHFDANGDKVSANYPDDGLDIFDNGEMSLENAVLDPNTGNVWVTAVRWGRSNSDVVSKELWVQLIGENVTGVPGVDPARVHGFSLRPAYPNPFNSTVTLRYELPEAGEVGITILDCVGRLVWDEKIHQSRAGYFVWTWDGRNISGASIPSGTYLCNLEYQTVTGVRHSATSKFAALK